MKLKDFLFKSDITVEKESVVKDNIKKKTLFENFTKEYPQSKELPLRIGASITCEFGLSNGYKIIDGKMKWGYVRIHSGVDRASGLNRTYKWGEVPNVVFSPFKFNRSSIIDYNGKSYGSLVRLYNDEYGFEFRIAHMNPNVDNLGSKENGGIIPWSLERLENKKSFKQGWAIGSAGSYGNSSGVHTHTEIKSINETVMVFDLLLVSKFGNIATLEYTDDEVISLYRQQDHYRLADEEKILKDYVSLRKEKKILFLNQFACRYTDWDDTIKTRYNSTALFKGL